MHSSYVFALHKTGSLIPSMLRITLNIELNGKPDKSGRSSIMVRLHMKGERPARVLTSVKIEKAQKYWNPQKTWGKWIIKHVDKAILNDKISKAYNRIQDQIEKWQEQEPDILLTPSILAERFRGGVSDRYFELVDSVLEDTKVQAYATYIAKRSAVNAFRNWADKDLPLKAVSARLCQQFQMHLRKTPTDSGKNRKASTVNKMIDRLHSIHKHVLIKTGVSSKQAEILSPWTEIEALSESKPQKDKFNEIAIKKMAEVNLKTTRRAMTPERALHMWLMAYFFAGMRFSDVLQLRYCNFQLDQNDDPIQLRYEMLKTGNTISISVNEVGQFLIKLYWQPAAKPTDYLLPYLHNDRLYSNLLTHEQYKNADFATKRRLYNDIAHWNRQANLCIKEIEQAAGFTEKLRMHNARYSFAEHARSIMQKDKTITVYDIQLMLGHSSFKTTEGYYNDSSSQDSTDAINAIFQRKS